jgi:crotonobetainyl-CoA:carnitine CoA-transferase CaiB-like acyl-CoA transferase
MSDPWPLAHVRVVELTTAWAGPMAGRILAFLGAEVIHVEAAGRLDSWRHHSAVFNPRRFPGGVAGERPYNRASMFNSQNVNKLSLTLDLKKPGGSDAFLALLKTADVLICNFTPGMLERVGFGYGRLKEIKPDIIVCEMPAYGLNGPTAQTTALGPTMEMAAGMASMIGYRGGPPVSTGPAYLDPIGGFNGAAAILTALFHRDRTGQGQHVEVPQVEAAMQFIGEHLLHAAATGQVMPRNGNRVPFAAPHDAYPAAGEDEWVAVAVETDLEFAALCRVIGRPEVADDARFARLEDRLRHADELDQIVSAWTRGQPKADAARLLQAERVSAAPVQNARDAAESDYLAARSFFTDLNHPEAGRYPHQGLPFHLSGTPGGQRTPAPCLGQHTRQILEDMLGLAPEEIARMDAAGTTAAVPVD